MPVRTAAELQHEIDTLIETNNSKGVTAADVRSVLTDVKDSIPTIAIIEGSAVLRDMLESLLEGEQLGADHIDVDTSSFSNAFDLSLIHISEPTRPY